MSKTISIEIPAPPDGWVYEKRPPKKGENFMRYRAYDGEWEEAGAYPCDQEGCEYIQHAYRVRDEYAERYEALKLPDGWAWTGGDGVSWSESVNEVAKKMRCDIRRIVNGKAVRP